MTVPRVSIANLEPLNQQISLVMPRNAIHRIAQSSGRAINWQSRLIGTCQAVLTSFKFFQPLPPPPRLPTSIQLAIRIPYRLTYLSILSINSYVCIKHSWITDNGSRHGHRTDTKPHACPRLFSLMCFTLSLLSCCETKVWTDICPPEAQSGHRAPFAFALRLSPYHN